MAASTLITDYIAHGTAAARPVTPNVPATSGSSLYFADDTGELSAWDGSAWQPVGGGGSTPPTSVGSGLTTWLNQGSATIADTAAGICLRGPSTGTASFIGRYKAAPATPYTITAKIAVAANPTNFIAVGIGWYNGTDKLHLLEFMQDTGWKVKVEKWSSATAGSVGADFAGNAGEFQPIYLQLNDDGTNAKFRISHDGVNFLEVFSIAKASGYLGGSGYTNVIFGTDPLNAATVATLMEYDET